MSELIQNLIIWAPGVLLSITLHEWAHGFAATQFGDETPRLMGRLTLNPLPHIDPVWTIAIPILMLVTSLSTTGQAFVFGGAKPVPINTRQFKGSFRSALFWVATAGPLMNFLLALVSALLFRVVILLPHFMAVPLSGMLIASIQMNVLLAIFNLLPIPPLDGGRVMVATLPHPLDQHWSRLEPLGLPLVLALAFTGVLGMMIGPVISATLDLYLTVAGINN